MEAKVGSLETQIMENKEPIKEKEEALENLLHSRLTTEEKMATIRKSIDETSDRIRRIEKEI